MKIPVVGLGGIATWQDAVEMLLAGASALQIGTVLFTDPYAPVKILEGLNRYLDEEKLASVTELTAGSARGKRGKRRLLILLEDQFYLPVRLLGGRDAVCRNAQRFAPLGKRCLLVTGRSSAVKSGAQADVTAALDAVGIAWRVFDGIGENPLLSDCEQAARMCAEFGAEFVVGIGGGSPMDAAKAVAVLAANPAWRGRPFTPARPETARCRLFWSARRAGRAAR